MVVLITIFSMNVLFLLLLILIVLISMDISMIVWNMKVVGISTEMKELVEEMPLDSLEIVNN